MVKTFHTTCIAIQRQCNDATIDSVKYRSLLRYMLKSVNTPMQKTDNVTC